MDKCCCEHVPTAPPRLSHRGLQDPPSAPLQPLAQILSSQPFQQPPDQMQLQSECLLWKSSTAPTTWRDARPAHLPVPCAHAQSIIAGSQAKATTQHHHCRLCACVLPSGSRAMTTTAAMRTVRHAQQCDGHGMFSQLCLADTHENLGAVTPIPHPPGRQPPALSAYWSRIPRACVSPLPTTSRGSAWHPSEARDRTTSGTSSCHQHWTECLALDSPQNTRSSGTEH